jgi:hypothetical protein
MKDFAKGGTMPEHEGVHGNSGGGLRKALATITGAALVVVTLGCCDIICPPPDIPEPPATHSIAFAVDTTRCPCPEADCVCPVPEVITVDPGDTVHLVNASPFEVTIEPSVPGSFNEGDTVPVAPKQTVVVTVSGVNAPGTQVSLNMTVADPGKFCPGLPGPRMDIDD